MPDQKPTLDHDIVTVYWSGKPVGHVEQVDGDGYSRIGVWKQARTSLAEAFASQVSASLEINYENRIAVEAEIGPDRSVAEITDLENGMIAWIYRPGRLAGG